VPTKTRRRFRDHRILLSYLRLQRPVQRLKLSAAQPA
jgi:hypothetical protein